MLMHVKKAWPSHTNKGAWDDPETVPYILRLYKEGYSYNQICELTSINRTSLYRLLTRTETLGNPYHKITDAKIDMVKRLIDEGNSQLRIAKILGVSKTAVWRFLRRHGIDPPKRHAPTQSRLDFEHVRELWEQGMTQAQIGDIYGVAQDAISRCMRKNGILLMNRTGLSRKPCKLVREACSEGVEILE